MARVTVEDCIEIVPNRFELVTLAAARTRQIASGSQLTVERDNDKDAVVALREIAEKTVSTETLKEEVIIGHQKYGKVDTIDDSAPQIGTSEISSEAKEELDSMTAAPEDDIDLGIEEPPLEDAGDDSGLAFGDDDIVDVED